MFKKYFCRLRCAFFVFVATPYAVLGVHSQSNHQNGYQKASEAEQLQQECKRFAPFFLEAIRQKM